MRFIYSIILGFFVAILSGALLSPTAWASCIVSCFVSKIQVKTCRPVVLPNGLKGKELTGKIIEDKQVKCNPRLDKDYVNYDISSILGYRQNAKEFFSKDESDCSQLVDKITEQFSGDECCDTGPSQEYCAAKGIRVRFTPPLIKNMIACDDNKQAESCYLVWQQGMQENESVYKKEDLYLKKSCDLGYAPACKVVEERAKEELKRSEADLARQKEYDEYIRTACQGDWEKVETRMHCLAAASMTEKSDPQKALELYRIACDKKGRQSLQGCSHARRIATDEAEEIEFHNKAKALYDEKCPSRQETQMECEVYRPDMPFMKAN